MKRLYLLGWAIFLLLAACQQSGFFDFKSGEFQCDNCRMSIVDMRYKAEVRSPKGKLYYFDSIECMNDWSKEHPDQVGTQWVTNYYDPSQWLDAKKALIMVGNNIPSPMGGHLLAVATEEEWRRAQKEFGGKKVAHP
ncbi:MAG: hypothetical protein COV45_01230 [Deltaproteobacteria bacterium CG11_big_fil_rev_8_21_14_0_20_47_16]|nr:MAG: hypothetical protein COV45_01230 [Deltaproteobacteria bacterium CG11_big_fil_rev_8_21_14_0_20_47_16]